MNNLLTIINSATTTTTISSIKLVEIINELRDSGRAELRHDTFMVKLEKVIGVGVQKFKGSYIHPQNGQTYPCYRLPKREASLMLMSESYAIQAKVYDRMVELETTAPKKPESKLEWMRQAIETEEQLQQVQVQNTAQQVKIALDAPKVEMYDRSA